MNHDWMRTTYSDPSDGNTYYLAPLSEGEREALWACPRNVDGTADFGSAIPETDFAVPLSPEKREQLIKRLKGSNLPR